MKKIIRTSTIAASLDILVKGQLRFLNEHFEVVAVSGEDQHLENVRNREGVRTFSVPMQRQISPLKDLVSLYRLYVFFKKEKPDIVHSMTPKAGLLSMAAARFAGVPVRIHTFTGLIFPSKHGFMQKLLIFMDRLLCSCATHIYPEGQGVKKDLVDYQITSKPLNVIANGNVNGVDNQYFDPALYTENDKNTLKAELKITPENFTYIFIGRLVGDKGINELIAAFKKLAGEKPQVKLLLVGGMEAELDPLMPETVAEISSNPNIISVGFQPDIRPYLAISDALAFASYREGFPNVVLQAGAMGLSSIVSDINGCNEIIEPGKNGIIIPVKNAEALYANMDKLASDQELQTALRRNARPLVVEKFSQKEVWNALLHAYEKNGKNV